MKHTPGPWKIVGLNEIEGPSGNNVVADGEGCWCPIVNDADAQLIASAPDMLEALKYVVKYHRDNDSGEGELFGLDFVTTCISAISKAERSTENA